MTKKTITQDIRWIQRFSNFKKALFQLQTFIDKGKLSSLEEQGLIKSFEYTYELAWKSIKDFYEFQGESNIQGSRDAIRLAFKQGLIEDGETWMSMIESRNQTSHTYNEDTAKEVAHAIVSQYFPLFLKLKTKLESLQ